jgi:arylsulfatase
MNDFTFRLGILTAAVVLGIVGMAAHAADAPPNVVVILIDDSGYSDLGCYGSEVPTPNINALADSGLRFTQFYNTARCSPTRASLMTGLYPHQAGLGFLESLVVPGSKGTQGHLRDDCVTMAEVLGDAGYLTIMTGKWHMGQNRGTPPWARGFQRSLSSAIGETYFPNQRQQRENGLTINGKRVDLSDPVLGKKWYGTDLLTDWGLKFIDEAIAAKKPFFYYLPYCATHFPLQVPQEDIAKFRGKYLRDWDKIREERHARQIELALVDAKWEMSPRPKDVFDWNNLSDEEKDRFDHIMAIYSAMMSRIDRSVGTLVDGLKKRGVLDNTLILIMADNGGNAESGPRGRLEGQRPGGPGSTVFLGQCWATVANTPFRRYKHFTHEGGISSPLVVHWPKGIAAERHGKLVMDPAHVIDVMPTVLELSGANYPKEFQGHAIPPMEGVSLLPAFAGQPLERKEPIFFAHEGNRAVRSGKWKAVMKFKGPWELYDMEADRTEQHNLIDKEPEVAKKLIAQWEAWAKRADVDPWQGEARTDWGEEIKKPAAKKVAQAKKAVQRKRRQAQNAGRNAIKEGAQVPRET